MPPAMPVLPACNKDVTLWCEALEAADLLETVTDAGAALPRSISTSSSLESVSSRLAGCGT